MLGYMKNPKKETPDTAENVTPVAVEEATLLYETKQPSHYEVMIDANFIVLREVFKNGSGKELERIKINTELLPEKEVDMLRGGMAFTKREEALMLIENFVS